MGEGRAEDTLSFVSKNSRTDNWEFLNSWAFVIIGSLSKDDQSGVDGQQRQKTMIWLAKCVKIIALHVRQPISLVGCKFHKVTKYLPLRYF